ncbi:MAG: ATP-binding cassette domain-containing protein [Ginsengibacter sp.]
MFLECNDVVPVFLEQDTWKDSEIWGKHITFHQSTYTQIVAPSGTGKTSFIHFLYGLRSDYSGSIKYNDTNLRSLSISDLSGFRQKNISIVFQDSKLFKDLTVFDNINVKRQLVVQYPEEKISEMSDQLGIFKKLRSQVSTCSYGEQQRVAIIRSLMQPFDFLILDEPFSHLDEKNKEKAMALIISECKKRNAGLIQADLRTNDFFSADQIRHL